LPRFYPSIYTYPIPWALSGKDKCKAQMNTKALKSSYVTQLDVFVRNMHDRQATGIPTGPETSRILAEVISVAIDIELQRLYDLPYPAPPNQHARFRAAEAPARTHVHDRP